MAGSDPAVKQAISGRMVEIGGGDVLAKNTNEFVRILGLEQENISRTRVKAALSSMIYASGHVTRYHDREGKRHFLLRRPFVAEAS